MCCSSKDAFKGVCGGGLIHTADFQDQAEALGLEGVSASPLCPGIMELCGSGEIRKMVDKRTQTAGDAGALFAATARG